jgi:hypothetical protein
MANIANTTLPEYISGMLNGADWVNQMNSILAFAAIQENVKKEVISASFTPNVGTLYLIAAGSISPYTPGTIAIWYDPTKPPQGFNPASGTVIGGWTKNTAGNDWVNNSITDCRNGSIFKTTTTVPLAIIIPNLLEGEMTIVHAGSAFLTVFPGSGRTGLGKVSPVTPLSTGVYKVFQDSSVTVI